MKIHINISGRYKERDDVKKLFQKYALRIEDTLKLLSGKYDFKLPKKVLLRPMYVKGGYYPYHGRAIYSPWSDYEILMNIETCAKMKDNGFEVLDHECVHIANDIAHGDFTHGERFKKMYAACKNKKKLKKRER